MYIPKTILAVAGVGCSGLLAALLDYRHRRRIALQQMASCPYGDIIDASELLSGEHGTGRSLETAGITHSVTRADGHELSIRAMGDAEAGAIWFMVRGATPNKPYKLEAWYPKTGLADPKPYRYLASGRADQYGAAPGMRWDPFDTQTGWPDPEGVYSLLFIDDSGLEVKCYFIVRYGRSMFGWCWWVRAVASVTRKQSRRLLRLANWFDADLAKLIKQAGA